MDEFKKARIKLTIVYISISFIMLFIFFIAAFSAQNLAFTKIRLALSDKVQRPTLTKLLEQRIENYELDFSKTLILYILILLVITSVSSWYLSGLTLAPIQKIIKKQEEFIADVSHELRTPLTIINMEIESAKRTKNKLPSLKSIQEESKNMSNLIQNLLSLARLNNNSNTKETVNFSKVVQQNLHRIESQTLEKKLKVFQTIQKDILVYGNNTELNRLLLIFLDNAIKFVNTKGTISVSLAKNLNHTTLEISNTGQGIDTQDLPFIFNRFYKSNNSQGSGLGLSIAKNIIDQHKGNITVKSKPKLGTSFTIILPTSS